MKAVLKLKKYQQQLMDAVDNAEELNVWLNCLKKQ